MASFSELDNKDKFNYIKYCVSFGEFIDNILVILVLLAIVTIFSSATSISYLIPLSIIGLLFIYSFKFIISFISLNKQFNNLDEIIAKEGTYRVVKSSLYVIEDVDNLSNHYYFRPVNIDWIKYKSKKHIRKVKFDKILAKIDN